MRSWPSMSHSPVKCPVAYVKAARGDRDWTSAWLGLVLRLGRIWAGSCSCCRPEQWGTCEIHPGPCMRPCWACIHARGALQGSP